MNSCANGMVATLKGCLGHLFLFVFIAFRLPLNQIWTKMFPAMKMNIILDCLFYKLSVVRIKWWYMELSNWTNLLY